MSTDLTPEHTARRTSDNEGLHPEVAAAYRYVERVIDSADIPSSKLGGPLWFGWALREAFLAGCSYLSARAALAQSEPEGVGVTDALPRQWYSYCPEQGIELHLTKDLAQKAAREIMGEYARHAHSDGWHEDMESVSWGALLPAEKAHVVEHVEAEPGSEFDEWVRYELGPVGALLQRCARPAIEPVLEGYSEGPLSEFSDGGVPLG